MPRARPILLRTESARLSDVPGEPGFEPQDLGSLLAARAQLERDRPPQFRVHDRTHLELIADYRLDPKNNEPTYEWDAYFFVPESLRLHDQTYEKHEIYDDLLSYVRLEVPDLPFTALGDEPLRSLERALAEGSTKDAKLRELRLFACYVRVSTQQAQRAVRVWARTSLERGREAAIELAAAASQLTVALRAVLSAATPRCDDEAHKAIRWVDEDVSRLIETMLATIAVDLRDHGASPDDLAPISDAAAEQARYRRDFGLDGVGTRAVKPRDVEHLEFRRHVLKRFTSSVLWLDLQVREAGVWVRQLVLAIAASVAMGFAFAAAMMQQNGTSQSIWASLVIVVLAYAAKDRIKAILQAKLTKFVSRVFPDREWKVTTRGDHAELAEVYERSGFVPASDLPIEALELRRSSRRFAIEAAARPERILWHSKTFTLDGEALAARDPRFTGLSEVCRINVRRWLDHTDDPKRPIVFADPDDNQIYSATAKRVYNIAIVYRLRRRGDNDAPWRRVRVVVTRKGILRIDRVDA